MLRLGLILTSHRDYAQPMRTGLLTLGDDSCRVDIELDALRAMQLAPQQYDLILLDTLLDAMDGMQLLQLLKHQAPTTKFIIVSDLDDEIIRAQAYQNGADYFLLRPNNAAALQTALESIRGLLKRHADTQPVRDMDGEPVVNAYDKVQTHCLSGDSVLLTVRGASHAGDIFIYRGEIYHAQYPGKSGEGAFHDIMHWDGGQLRVRAIELPQVPPRTIETPYRELLDATAQNDSLKVMDVALSTGELLAVSADSSSVGVTSVAEEAPPLTDAIPETPALATQTDSIPSTGETALPQLNSHWKVNLMGELVEGSQVSEPDRCAFITYFIYRKMADVAVTLQLDYFNQLTLIGPHLHQVIVADNLGARHAVFESAWTTEEMRNQYVQWCREQSL